MDDIIRHFKSRFPELVSTDKYPQAADWMDLGDNAVIIWFRVDGERKFLRLGNKNVPVAKNVISVFLEYDKETDNFIFKGIR